MHGSSSQQFAMHCRLVVCGGLSCNHFALSWFTLGRSFLFSQRNIIAQTDFNGPPAVRWHCRVVTSVGDCDCRSVIVGCAWAGSSRQMLEAAREHVADACDRFVSMFVCITVCPCLACDMSRVLYVCYLSVVVVRNVWSVTMCVCVCNLWFRSLA